jgi:hypothetical protein
LYAANPNSAQAARDVSVSFERLGAFYVARGQAGDAEAALTQFEESLRIDQELYAANPNSAQAARDVLVSLERMADVSAAQEQEGAAEVALDWQIKALELAFELYKKNPTSVFFGRTAVVTCFKTYQRAEATGNTDLANRSLGGCHAVLHDMMTAGFELDESMVKLYEQLHPLFEKGE